MAPTTRLDKVPYGDKTLSAALKEALRGTNFSGVTVSSNRILQSIADSLGTTFKSSVEKQMATSTRAFTHISLSTKILKMNITTYRKVLKSSNLTYTISLGLGQNIGGKYGFPCILWAVIALHGIAAKCTAAIFFTTKDVHHLSKSRKSFQKITGEL